MNKEVTHFPIEACKKLTYRNKWKLTRAFAELRQLPEYQELSPSDKRRIEEIFYSSVSVETFQKRVKEVIP